jgi:hypothetical protein
MEQKLIATMTGYKAFNKDLQCTPNGTVFQFEIGKWYEVEGELVECKNGFHFCQSMSGVWCYYNKPNTRICKIEARDILDTKVEPGSDHKRVCRMIKITEELRIEKDSQQNTGYCNTGDRNTGSSNTGNSNTGYYNTGNSNTGYCNTSDRNTGDRNTGYCNTGDRNTGSSNTGDYNTGSSNTGYRNTGNCNTGDHNTGYCNTGDRNTGYFELGEPKVTSFGVKTQYTYDEFWYKFSYAANILAEQLRSDAPIDVSHFKEIPGITQRRLNKLHAAMKAARSNGGN